MKPNYYRKSNKSYIIAISNATWVCKDNPSNEELLTTHIYKQLLVLSKI